MRARQTLERRQLGLSLKRHRSLKGASQAEVGAAIGRSDSRISKVEDGTATLDADELGRVLDFLDVPADERSTVLELGARARRRLPRGAAAAQPYTDTLPGSFQRLADLEADAVAIHCYEPGLVPGLLQAPGYTRSVVSSCDGVFWESSEVEVENRCLFRRQRQRTTLGASEPKRFEFVFTEDALAGADREVLREQLEHLLKLVEQRPDITVQVLRPGDIRNPAPNGGVTVLDFGGTAPSVAFTPTVYGPSTYFDDEADAAALLRAFRAVQGLARDHAASVDLIRRTLEEL
ncbi:helix-turn-helix domain-containing protein [Saccharothrix yanglingensis]|uniref:Transcriptional regulator n=1 Tax=Saccharothrix yanglingensis TaxID=659496 RepID=A0ABU0WSD3_9PSEU|nr:helix-turn-helix transcriptional regulator [Saccharothrix yanglingensis]MDQ2582657.1 transcriptional regulator [Saccharothrix yanglingensis]